MKTVFNKTFFLLLASLVLCACEKDETRVVAKRGTPGALVASQTSLTLSSSTAGDTVQAFSWAPTDYGFPAAVKYTLQIAKGGTDFAALKEVNTGSNRAQKYTGADFNQMALLLGLPPGSPGQLDVRVKSAIADSIPAIYSNKVTLSVTPYIVIINYPSLWVPGDYQGWNPAVAPKISSKAGNGIYEGYVYFPPASPSFKFKLTSNPDWNHTNYGLGSSTTNGKNVAGSFNTTGGDLTVPGAGYYLLKANTNTRLWEAIHTTWGIIGDAVPVTAWTSDQDLAYDVANQVFKITLNLVPGKIKFRANDDWAINFGDTGADQSLDYGGTDITVATAGNYTVTFDLHVAGNYTYSVKKN